MQSLSEALQQLRDISIKLDSTMVRIAVIEKQIEAIETELWGHVVKDI
tara:strand:- start:1298 stop:1441 length:144 start_codon:yes stop_codon:yes gene_type:complete